MATLAGPDMSPRPKLWGWKVVIPRVVGPPVVKVGKARTMEGAKADAGAFHGPERDLGIGTCDIYHKDRKYLSWRDGQWKITAWETVQNTPEGEERDR